jgi:hypothetical protein
MATLQKQGVIPIGAVTGKRQSVQRRFAERVIWDQLRIAAGIYNGDLVRTGALGSINIDLTVGDTIQLGEDTLTRIFYDETGMVIDVLTGNVRVKTAQGSKLRVISSGRDEVIIEQNRDVAVYVLDDEPDIRVIPVEPGAVLPGFYDDGELTLKTMENAPFQMVLDGKPLPRQAPPRPPAAARPAAPPAAAKPTAAKPTAARPAAARPAAARTTAPPAAARPLPPIRRIPVSPARQPQAVSAPPSQFDPVEAMVEEAFAMPDVDFSPPGPAETMPPALLPAASPEPVFDVIDAPVPKSPRLNEVELYYGE